MEGGAVSGVRRWACLAGCAAVWLGCVPRQPSILVALGVIREWLEQNATEAMGRGKEQLSPAQE